VRQDPTLQVLPQLALDVSRQGTLVRLAGLCEKRFEVLSDKLRYMQLAPRALCEAIDLLNFGQAVGSAESTAV
jgi:hypothetical protein